MSTVAYSESRYKKALKAFTAAGLVAVLAGCSTSSDRFGPFDGGANQTSSNNQMHTGSTAQASSDHAVYSNEVTSQPLGSPGQPATYSQPAPQLAVYTPARGSVMVNQGDTLYSISRRHNVRVNDLIAINNIQPPYTIKTGQTLVLPGGAQANNTYAGTPASSNAVAHPASHRVRAGETMYSISRGYGHRPETVAAYNNIGAPYTVKIGQTLRVPPRGWQAPVRTANSPTPAPQPVSQPVATQPAATQPAANQTQVASVPSPSQTTTQSNQAPATVPPRTSSQFRWPVKGRIISQFGEKQGGSRNDGINLAVPAGTSIKAAENGVVAYAGNELRGYGNLVLIRHADNWVTAYAHASELFVRRGDVVSRGQIIAKAGDTGNVTSPQLHFEIRRGAQAVDPIQYLAPDTVAGN